MKRATLAVIILLVAGGFLLMRRSRRHAAEPDVVVVRVFRDNKSEFRSNLDRRLYSFNDQQRRTETGKYIVVATMEPYDYRAELDGKVARVQPQLVVLDSVEDTKLLADLGGIHGAKSACGVERNCPAFIPAWVRGDELNATKQVFDFITTQ